MRFRSRLVALAAVSGLSFIPVHAFADEAAENFLKSWIENIDASPDWIANYSDLASDNDTDRTTLTGLTIEGQKSDFSVSIRTIAVTGFTSSDDGALAAKEFDADGISVDGGSLINVSMEGAKFSDFAFPAMNGFAFDETRPFASIVEILKPLAQIRMARGEIGSIVLTQTVEDVKSTTSYDGLKIDNWADGRIASIVSGQLKTSSPENDALIAITATGVESRDIDFDAMLNVFDPSRYANGVGDLVWHTVVGSASYGALDVTAPGVKVTMAGATVENLRVRQPKGGIQTLLDLGVPGTGGHNASDEPPVVDPLKFVDLLSVYGFGKFQLDELDVQAVGVDKLRFGSFSISDFSSDQIGEFAIDNFETTVAGQGSVKLGRFAFGGLVFPPLDKLIAAAGATETGDNVDYSSLAPRLGFVELAGLDVALDTAPKATVERFRADFGNYAGPVPTSVAVDLSGADIAVGQIDDEKARQTFEELGYDRVNMSAGMKVEWTDDKIDLKEFHFAMQDFGTLSGEAQLSGLRPSDMDNFNPDTDLEKLSFVRGSATFKDDSIVGRGLAFQAGKLKTDPAKFREQFALGLPLMLAFLGDQDLQKQLAPVLQALVRTTRGSITATAEPTLPVALAVISATAETSPFALLKMLQVTITGAAGETPKPGDVPELKPTIEPSPAPAEPAPAEPAPAEPAPTVQ